ncbi:MAG: PIN domain nuclease [Armatimonadetes bacterium]|nr:PIN domain nuclease [Armatimonadota bacterium]MDE2207779.1 PIN domain nuclease [Armatimonadota bacterium]
MWRLGTNILLRTVGTTVGDHITIRTAVRDLRNDGQNLTYLSQNLIEFWNVCTRSVSVRGGFGFPVAEADRGLKLLERLFTLLPDSPATHTQWRRVVVAHGVQGVHVHDARRVAAMYVYGITHVLTPNPVDFQRYPNVTSVHPGEV